METKLLDHRGTYMPFLLERPQKILKQWHRGILTNFKLFLDMVPNFLLATTTIQNYACCCYPDLIDLYIITTTVQTASLSFQDFTLIVLLAFYTVSLVSIGIFSMEFYQHLTSPYSTSKIVKQSVVVLVFVQCDGVHHRNIAGYIIDGYILTLLHVWDFK